MGYILLSQVVTPPPIKFWWPPPPLSQLRLIRLISPILRFQDKREFGGSAVRAGQEPNNDCFKWTDPKPPSPQLYVFNKY